MEVGRIFQGCSAAECNQGVGGDSSGWASNGSWLAGVICVLCGFGFT